MFRVIKKVLIFFALVLVLACTSFADSVDPSSVAIGDLTDEEMEELTKNYMDEINEAFKSVEFEKVYNLPTLFEQPTYHPKGDCFFGEDEDRAPIFKVKVEKDDMERKGCIAFTFDSAYINTYTYDILDVLDQYDAKATFFMTYDFMSKNPKQVMEIIKRGHEIGNHSTTHPDLNTVSDAEVVRQVMKAHNYMKYLLGVELCLFRFPFGSYSPRTITLIKNMGYYPIQWKFDSVDWRNISTEYLINRFTENSSMLAEGNIILFHNGATYTPEALPVILDMVKEKGLRCVRVTDLIYKEDFHLTNGTQIRGKYEINETDKEE